MERTGKGMLILEKFLCCFSLRAGTVFIAWWTFLCSFFLSIILLTIHCEESSPGLLLIIGILLSGMFISGKVLWHFPISNKGYSSTSINMKSLYHLTIYNEVLAAIGVLAFVVICVDLGTDGRRYYNHGFFFVVFLAVVAFTGLHIHLAAVVYSYRLSMLKTDGNINNLISKNFNLATNTNENGTPNVPLDLQTEPVYSECALVNNQNYELIGTAGTSAKIMGKNDFP